MKKGQIIILTIILIGLCILGGYFLFHKDSSNTITDAQKFADEYQTVGEDNVFVYRTVDEIIQIMEHGTGVVYLGYPECPWCKAYVPYLNEIAKEVGIEKIYYCNTKQLKAENMEKYYQLVELLHGHLQYNDEGQEWIYVPNVSFHINGEIIGNDYETSKDTHGLKNPQEYWTEEEVIALKDTLRNYMQPVFRSLNMCTDCNK